MEIRAKYSFKYSSNGHSICYKVRRDCIRFTKVALRTLDPVHHKGARLALGVFAICNTFRNMKTEYGKCRVKNPNQPDKAFFLRHEDSRRIFTEDEYLLKTNTPTPIFTRIFRKMQHRHLKNRNDSQSHP
jgi:hypothetical protein